MVDDVLVTELVRVVHDAFEVESTRRTGSGTPRLDRHAQEALAVSVVQREFRRIDERRLSAGTSRLTPVDEDELLERVVAQTAGNGPVDPVFAADPTVEEIAATRWDLIFTNHTDGSRRLLAEPIFKSEAEMVEWVSHQARTAGRTERQFNAQNPLLVLRIGEGLRLAATRDVSANISFALRRNTVAKGGGLGALVDRGMMPAMVAELVGAWMGAGFRIVIVGETAAGKTTFARACLDGLDSLLRIVVIEDTAELDLFDPVTHPNVESWEERLANNEGEGAVSLSQLVRHALRYRPDWLVCGEVRDSDAAVPMLKAMTHGQASLTTVHAQSAVAGLDKLALYLGTGEDRLPIEVAHHQLSQAIDFVVHIDRDPTGRRVVSEIVEVAGFDAGRCATNTIYDGADGGHTMQRFTQTHVAQLAAVGFDVNRLGGVWR